MTAENPEYYKSISVTREGEKYVINERGGPTTQGDTYIEALLMLADAKRSDEENGQHMMKLAAEVFLLDKEDEKFIREELQE